MLTSYVCYSVSQLTELSGIMALFVCGFVFSKTHFISDKAKQASEIVLSIFATMAECLVFVYLGVVSVISVRQLPEYDWGNVWLFGYSMVLIFGARAIHTFVISGGLNLYYWLRRRNVNANVLAENHDQVDHHGDHSQRGQQDQQQQQQEQSKYYISFKGQLMILIAGLRGAISFALSLRIPHQDAKRKLIPNTIFLIAVTTLGVGSLMEHLAIQLGFLKARESTSGRRSTFRSARIASAANNDTRLAGNNDMVNDMVNAVLPKDSLKTLSVSNNDKILDERRRSSYFERRMTTGGVSSSGSSGTVSASSSKTSSVSDITRIVETGVPLDDFVSIGDGVENLYGVSDDSRIVEISIKPSPSWTDWFFRKLFRQDDLIVDDEGSSLRSALINCHDATDGDTGAEFKSDGPAQFKIPETKTVVVAASSVTTPTVVTGLSSSSGVNSTRQESHLDQPSINKTFAIQGESSVSEEINDSYKLKIYEKVDKSANSSVATESRQCNIQSNLAMPDVVAQSSTKK